MRSELCRHLIAASALLVAALGVLLSPPVAVAADDMCQGKPATIVDLDGGPVAGTEGADVIVAGTSAQISALGGDDTVCFRGGYVAAGGGHDAIEVTGTDGRDFVSIYHAEDLDVALAGGDDYLRLTAGDGGDGAIDAGAGVDGLFLVAHDSVMADLADGILSLDGDSSYTLTGFQNVIASAERVRLVGDGGPNRFEVDKQACHITMKGGRGKDWMSVIGADDDFPDLQCTSYGSPKLVGQAGSDRLKGSSRDDQLLGGAGRDWANGSLGTDFCRAEVRKACER